MLFQQLFEPISSTFTYILADEKTLDAICIDPVLETSDRDLKLIKELGLQLRYVLDTHVHADHVTGAARLKDETGAKIGLSAAAKATGADVLLKDGDVLNFGGHRLQVIATPGHTSTCLCYLVGDRVFTGDTLLFRGCGRTDFQDGSAETLYRNIQEKLFTLPDGTLVYAAHDYKGFTSSTIGIEKKCNPRLGTGKSLSEFAAIMNNLNLAPPKNIAIAVPANLKCGRI